MRLSTPSDQPDPTLADDENFTDRALLQGVIAGDRQAFRRLYHRFYHRLLRFIMRITRNLETAEEGVNDVMLAVWRQAGSFQGRSQVSTWIMGIAYRKALKLAQKSRRNADRFVTTDAQVVNELSGPEREPMEREELQDWLDVAMAQLSAEHRAVVEMTYFHGYSYKEIAAIMDCPVNTVKTRMFHARAGLRDILPALGRLPKRTPRENDGG
jgi:RNA polymerase sigma-70 factor (ECF subfamily)